MIFNFYELCDKYAVDPKGMIQIGAHYGEENGLYFDKQFQNILCFEPIPSSFKILKERWANKVFLSNLAIGNENKIVEMHVETKNDGQSCSVLAPDLHLQQYPHITFDTKLQVNMMTLDNFMTAFHSLYDCQFNFLNVDVQGFELQVFEGAKDYLNNIQYILTEVNNKHLYKDCVLVDELDDYLSQYNFKRKETRWEGQTWGDAFYIKE